MSRSPWRVAGGRVLRASPDLLPQAVEPQQSAFAVPVRLSGGLAGRWTIATARWPLSGPGEAGVLPAEDDAVGRTSNITGAANVTKHRQIVTITAAAGQGA